MAGMIANVGERAIVIRNRRFPGKLAIVVATFVALCVSGLTLENTSSETVESVPVERGWQAISIGLPQTAMEVSQTGDVTVATYHFVWNSTYDFSSLNWSPVDRSRTDQKYVLGLGAKIWVERADVDSDFPIEITQGDGTSLGYRLNYTPDRESPHIYLTGERTFWKWDRTPNIVHDYKSIGSCCIEDAWRNGTWTPEEGIALSFDPQGSLVLGVCDFAVQLLVYDMLLPELRSIAPIVALMCIGMIAFERRRRAH